MAIEVIVVGLGQRGRDWIRDVRASPEFKLAACVDRARSGFADLKRYSPAVFKKLYYKMAPRSLTYQLALPTILPRYDWEHTRAFALPTDQHGWIRINLIGREACGIVPADRYEETCEHVERELRGLRSERGEPLVRDVIRVARSVKVAMSQRLPDIVIHWSDAVFTSPLHIAGSSVKAETIGQKNVGQHSLEGFCILKSANGDVQSDEVRAEDLHLLLTGALPQKAVDVLGDGQYRNAVASGHR